MSSKIIYHLGINVQIVRKIFNTIIFINFISIIIFTFNLCTILFTSEINQRRKLIKFEVFNECVYIYQNFQGKIYT